MQEGLQRAVGVPLSLAERVGVLWPSLKETASQTPSHQTEILPPSLFPSQAAAKASETADVTVNLQDVADDACRRAGPGRTRPSPTPPLLLSQWGPSAAPESNSNVDRSSVLQGPTAQRHMPLLPNEKKDVILHVVCERH
ncbi:hypothetical protein Q5P01_005935 [Channa striata]|uniref:Uncharacterized protein n=1 Tax=Channa striata TaxID=64152 RepID=A0AA88T1P5_CHASR|nr:hypothetical protein Q5P01_005935 [Channa striata]